MAEITNNGIEPKEKFAQVGEIDVTDNDTLKANAPEATVAENEGQEAVVSADTEKNTAAEKKPARKRSAKKKAEEVKETVKEEVTDSKADVDTLKDEVSQLKDMISVLTEKLIASKEDNPTRRKIESASNRERKELYKEDMDVFTRKDEIVNTPAAQKKAEYMLLANNAASVPPTIVEGTILGYFDVSKEQRLGNFMVEVKIDGTQGIFPIYIPFHELFPYDEKNYSEPHYKENELKARAKKGNKIEFCITAVYEAEGIAIASRLMAMTQRGTQLFESRREDRPPRVYEGKVMNATVVSARQDRVFLSIDGAESELRSRDLSWTALKNLDEEYTAGETIPVKVMKVKPYTYTTNAPLEAQKRKYKMWDVELSAKEAQANPAELYYNHFFVGKVVSGEIKAYADKYVFVRIQDKMDCICRIPRVGRPIPGTECMVQITLMEDDTKRIFGKIVD